MKFFKHALHDEYYIANKDNETFFWFHVGEKEWRHSKEDKGGTASETWWSWCQESEISPPQEVSKLEVLLKCGSVPETEGLFVRGQTYRYKQGAK